MPANLWFRHCRKDAIQGTPQQDQFHCNCRNNFGHHVASSSESLFQGAVTYPAFTSPCGQTRDICNQNCPGTSYSSQIDAIEIEDDSLQSVLGLAFSDGAVLGGADKSTNTGGGAQDTNNWWLLDAPAHNGGRCVKRFEVPVLL